VLSDVGESMKRVKKGVFLVRKGLCTICNKVKIRKIREKRGKIRKTWSMTKKGHQKVLPLKWEFFQKKSSSWSRKFFPSPQTRRQVSAHAWCTNAAPMVATPLHIYSDIILNECMQWCHYCWCHPVHKVKN